MEMIQKQPMFVSHKYIVVMHLKAVSSYMYMYMYHHDILIGFSELNQGLACQVIKAQIVPFHLWWLIQGWVSQIGKKTMVRASDKVQEKL